MAYSSTLPPVLIAGGFGGVPMRMFVYESTHTVAAVAASSFISDGYSRGMRVGDIIHVNELTTGGALTGFATGRVSSASTGSGVTCVFAATST
jgi:hypothetical protein